MAGEEVALLKQGEREFHKIISLERTSRSSGPTPCATQDQLDQIAEDCVQSSFEYFQG